MHPPALAGRATFSWGKMAAQEEKCTGSTATVSATACVSSSPEKPGTQRQQGDQEASQSVSSAELRKISQNLMSVRVAPTNYPPPLPDEILGDADFENIEEIEVDSQGDGDHDQTEPLTKKKKSFGQQPTPTRQQSKSKATATATQKSWSKQAEGKEVITVSKIMN